MSIQLHPAMPQKLPTKKHCSSGNRIRPIYEYKMIEGWDIPRRVKSGEMDFQDYIQQSKDDVDFITLGKALIAHRENVSSHFKADGKDISLVDTPRNLGEYDVMYGKMKANFNALPKDVRNLFNDDLNVFADAWIKGSLKGTLDTYQKSLAKPTEPIQTEGGAE